MKRSPVAAGALGALSLLLACSTGAQDDRAPLSDVWLVQPKAGSNAMFEEAVRRHIAFRQDSGEERDWEVYAVAIGANPTIYQFRSGGMDWADFDDGMAEDAEKGFGANWMANVDQYVDHYHHYIETADYENSHWPPDMGQQSYYGVTSWTLKQNAGPGPDEARKELSRIGLEEGWAEMDYHWLWLWRIGGSDTLMIVTPHDSFADMAPPEQDFFEFVVEKVGQEEAGRLFSQFSEWFADSNYTVWAHRPDLSVTAAGSGDND